MVCVWLCWRVKRNVCHHPYKFYFHWTTKSCPPYLMKNASKFACFYKPLYWHPSSSTVVFIPSSSFGRPACRGDTIRLWFRNIKYWLESVANKFLLASVHQWTDSANGIELFLAQHTVKQTCLTNLQVFITKSCDLKQIQINIY